MGERRLEEGFVEPRQMSLMSPLVILPTRDSLRALGDSE